jgi:hypothetical protein
VRDRLLGHRWIISARDRHASRSGRLVTGQLHDAGLEALTDSIPSV